ncbi:hypothetical protein [Actinocorallia populi]|uniref:hypothetical protein n=1 Tax=Actinocorallia populi TaxID=2079200 RepID=UPI001300201A|nr:hypothetical protein [Actinocorallia populi]
MFEKTVKVVMTALVAAGMSAAVAVPADAAPKKPKKQVKCHLGLWKTTGLTANISGETPDGNFQDVDYKGMAGIKLKISTKRVVYDFTGSKRETIKGIGADGKPMEAWEQLTGVLYLPSKITSDKKGLKGQIASYNKRAAGPATGTGMTTKPEPASWGEWKVADHAKIGHFDTPVVKKAKFVCNPKKKTLRITDVRKWDTFTETLDMRFKLVRR